MRLDALRISLAVVLTVIAFSVHARICLVSVCVADYSRFPSKMTDLRLPPEDARTIVDLYSKNGSVDYSLLLDKKATKDRILRAIKKVFAMASEDDIAVFFFSGHGYPGGFCAYDGNLTYEEVRNAMAESKCRNKIMFVDACRSGGMRVDKSESRDDGKAAKDANVMLFLSSRNNESSIERSDMANGFFTTCLKNGLKGNADSNRDRAITAKELFDFVSEAVARLSRGKQHPVMWGNFSSDMVVMQW